MADVFIVGLLIVMYKADAFQFRFSAGAGLYSYAGAALLSSLTVLLQRRRLERELVTGKHITAQPKTTKGAAKGKRRRTRGTAPSTQKARSRKP